MIKKIWIIGCSDFALDIACRFNPNPEKKRGDLVDVVELVWDDGLIMKCRLEDKIEGTPGKQNTLFILKPGAPLVGFKINSAPLGIHTIFCRPSLNSPGL